MILQQRVLVTFGSKRGGTAEIAAQIAEVLRAEGCVVDLLPTGKVEDLDRYDGVVIGGALYMARWMRSVRRFVKRHADTLRRKPVWMFSSGPLDVSASARSIPPTPSVRALMLRVGARDHATFGGRLEPDARGFPAAQMAKQRAGDWRDRDQITSWARRVAADLWSIPELAPIDHVAPPRSNGVLAALCLLVGAAAIVGGIGLVAWPDGSALRIPLSILEHSPFETFLWPGLLLLVVIGLGSMVAGALVLRSPARGDLAAVAAGSALGIWILVQMAMLRTINALQLGCFVAAIAIMALALRHHQSVTVTRPAALRRA